MTTSPIASLISLAERHRPDAVTTARAVAALADDRAIRPVVPGRADLVNLLPAHGIPRGSTIVVDHSTTWVLALLAIATAAGSWAAVVGMPDLGLLAAHEQGAVLERVALVPDPGTEVAAVVAALLDGIDLVVVAAGRLAREGGHTPVMARRLAARARHRGAVLVPVGAGG